MATIGGPNTEKDGLVFGYDTGYGVSDKNTATRFYPGRPTSNLVPDSYTMSGWNNYSSGNDGTFITEYGTTGYKVRNKNTWNGILKSITLPSTGTYTISAWFRIWGKSSGNNGINVYTSGGGISDTAQGGDDTKIGEWQRIAMTRTYTTTSITFFIISWGGTRGTDWSSWDVTMPQIEKQSTHSPFSTGTRSSTQSLIDLKRTADIDVSNVSFDSTGQPTFDGTDDWLNVPVTLNAGNFTYETVMKQPSDASNVIFTAGTGDPSSGGTYVQAFVNSSGGRVNLYSPVGASGWQSGTYDNTGNFTSTANTWYHIVVANLDTTWKIYVNGNLVGDIDSFKPNVGNKVGVARSAMQQENSVSSQVSLVKIYNRKLTSAEIKQNFNAYKNRFDI